jgi:hypothetical protein
MFGTKKKKVLKCEKIVVLLKKKIHNFKFLTMILLRI